MATVKAFRGLMPTQSKAREVSAVPYDVISRKEAKEMADGKPLSFLHVSRPEIDLDDDIDIHDQQVYDKAAENFEKLKMEAPLNLDDEEHLYVYLLKMQEHEQIGIIGAASVSDYNNNIIKKHEKTRKDKEDDRTKHVMSLRSHTGPVFLTYRDSESIDSVIKQVIEEKPLFEAYAMNNVDHKIWRVDTEKSKIISQAFDIIPELYIADGHHRAAAASRVAAECASANPEHSGDEDYNFFLSVIFPASQTNILAYNRVVKDLNGLSEDQLLDKIRENFYVQNEESKDHKPERPGEICMYINGNWFKLTPMFDIQTLGVIEQLDVSILQDYILRPFLGIDDPRTSNRIDFVGGIRGTQELVKKCCYGEAEVAFSMYPTSVEQLMRIADSGEIMPPKSTWFEPKLRDGFISHNF